MIKLINPSGGETWVADNRVDEYKAAGFKPAADAEKPKKAPVKKTVKK